MTTQRGTVNKFLSTSALTLGLIASASATANAMDANTTPTGEQIVAGSATMDRPDASTLNINQNTDRVVINWDSFNIGSNAKTEFFQPNSGSLAVNRVTGRNSDPTQILGTLKANGRVMVLDRNGVVFGAGSRVDVGGIVASTGDVNDAAVMRGDTKLELSNFGDASVVNNGTISVTGAGLAALVAPHVANNGVIEARLGKIALAAGGERATVDLYGDGLVEIAVGGAKGKALAENAGVLSGATVLMTAHGAKEVVDTVINMSGVIQATSVSVQGGKIILDGGNAGKVKVSGTIDASGAAGGGEVKVVGESVILTDTSVVSADATSTGHGGRIGIWGNDYAIMGGRASARGGKLGGNGGFIELSAANNVGFDGFVDTSAEIGETGLFLIDPKTIKLGDYIFNDLIGDDWAIDDDKLALTLLFSNVHLWATDRIYTASDFNISTSLGTTTSNDLTLSAKTIDINHNITLGTGSLILRDALTTDSVFGFGLVRPSSDINLATVNLNAQILKKSGDLAGGNQIEGFSDVVNVMSPSAYISQGMEFVRAGGTVNVGNGTYNENVIINKSLTLQSMNGADFTEVRGVSGVGQDTTLSIANNLYDVTVGGVGTGIAFRGFAGADSVVKIGQQNSNAKIIDNKIIGAGAVTGVKVGGSGSYYTQISDNIVRNVTGTGIEIQGGSFATIQGNTVHNTGSDGIAVGGNSYVTINANTIFVTGGDGIDVRGGGLSSTYATITNNFIGSKAGVSQGANNVKGDGIVIDGAHGTDVSDNKIMETASTAFDVGSGIHFKNSNDVTISGNTLDQIDWDGVKISGGTNVLVDANTLSNVTRVAVYGGGFNGLTVSNNVINNAGAGLAGYGAISTDGGNNLSITGNTVNGNIGSGVKINGAGGTNLVDGNTIDNVGENGVEGVSVGGLTISNNTIGTLGAAGNIGGNGVSVSTSNGAMIQGNTVKNTAKNGVNVADSNNATVDGNTVVGAAKTGVNIVRGTNVTVSDNILRDIGNQGIRTEQVQTLNVLANTLRNVSWSGVEVQGGKNVTVSDNNLKDVRGNGVQISGSQGTVNILDNVLNDIRQHGIVVNGAPGAVVIGGNKVIGAEAFGIYTNGSKNVVVSDNRVSGGKNGIVVQNASTSAKIENNIVSGASAADRVASGYQTAIGILVKDSAGVVSVTGNRSNANTGDGIRILNTDGATVSGNITNDNGDKGIIINRSDDAVVDDNRANGNATGIWVELSNGVDLTNNVIRDSKVDGVHLRDSDNTLVSDNRILDNDGNGIFVERSDNADIFRNMITGSGVGTGVKVTGSSNTDVGAASFFSNRGNTITNFDNGVTVAGGNDNDVVRNTISGVDYGVRLSGTTNSDVLGNDLTGNSVVGIEVVAGSHNAVIDNNTLDHFDTGIVVNGSNNVEITGNDLTDVGSGIVANASNGLRVTGNDLTGRYNSGTAISVTNSDDVIIGGGTVLIFPVGVNSAEGFRNGIYADNVSNLRIRQNDLTGYGRGVGIDVRNSDGAIVGGVGFLTSYGSDVDGYNNGIRVIGSDDVEITQNDVANSTHNGIIVRHSDDAVVSENTVTFTGNDAITVNGSRDAVVNGNFALFFGGDGIVARNSGNIEIANNVVGLGWGNGIAVDGGNKAHIHGNLVGLLGGDGIVVAGAKNSLIENNLVALVGGNGVTLMPGSGINDFSDGSKVRNNTIMFVGGNGVDSYNTYGVVVDGNVITNVAGNGVNVEISEDTQITNNIVDGFGGHGIAVDDENAFVDIAFNTIQNGSGDAINVRDSENVLIRRNLINNVGSDGIDVANSDMVDIRRNVIDNVGADGIDVSDNDIVKIRRNTVSNVGDNGIEADDNRRVRIARNDISNAANNGIMIDDNNRVRIVSNLITNSGNAGLYAAGADNGVVILEDNVFTGSPIGAWFESGVIDLTGATNTFNGGDIGMRFAPVGNPNDLTLVGNTIGTTAFNGQSQYYIELANAAFFAPGLPTILNGLNASYDGFVPNSVGGILTKAQFDAIESKIYHFNDDGSLGLFFFGAVPGIDDEDVYNRFGDLNWAGGRFRMTILGLPSVPGAGANRVGANSPAGQPGFTGNVAEFLANLAPAAGGDDQQGQRGQSVSIAGQLADLEPAAGGDGGEVSCWSDAMNQAAGGGAVSYSFGGSMEESLSQAASCGGAI
ncbi:right-handed parallel beta-helix repeat-containing protein [Micavibrio aeruginosavorus]|uniref:Large exoproteins involved in heme utilization or adhesion n=1 Tax=Micavibrio aeruginosavorus EPB TaxID=349215 RepID=M4VHQ8_9BACT|nr:right-handed parallel beta-helix repeat-containing protein [Micavibrio aeruginosavorus]AGH98743.1 Large exoproteins involved in heme utilization or adhesion [Micavibrio aeruginosavorus EPB]